MLRTILLPTDGSAHAEVAARYAAWLARGLGAAARLLYVQDIRITSDPVMPAGYLTIPGAAPVATVTESVRLEDLQLQGEAVLKLAARPMTEAGVRWREINVSGIVDETILEESRCADLIVMGQKGVHVSFTHDALGSTTERVLRKSIKPVLVTPAEFREIRKLLVAYDASAKANLAFEKACDLCNLLRLPMVLFTCREGSAGDGPDDHETEMRKQAERIRETCSFELEVVVVEGHPEEEILKGCQATGADLIVMGAYGHSRLRELLLGSTTNLVILKSTLPVLLMR